MSRRQLLASFGFAAPNRALHTLRCRSRTYVGRRLTTGWSGRTARLAVLRRSTLLVGGKPARFATSIVTIVRDIGRMKVRAILQLLREDGWAVERTRGSHRQLSAVEAGTVTVSGKPGVEVPPGTLNSILKQAGLK
ncbi:MAG: type II toxin-antitoxin system HicA family toxin [Woeseiaceae bacterium]|nr:type II toxin-antitoxin system HicA family toxin [Woeseiaceae bacterium]